MLVLRELAANRCAGEAVHHLVTVPSDPSPTSSSFIHSEPCLYFNSLQTCIDLGIIVPMLQADKAMHPATPCVMTEAVTRDSSLGGCKRHSRSANKLTGTTWLAGTTPTGITFAGRRPVSGAVGLMPLAPSN